MTNFHLKQFNNMRIMKTKVISFLLLIILMIAGRSAMSQVSINSAGAPPAASAMLDVSSASMGILIPRMTLVERDAIGSPATGLLVYVTTDNLYYYYDGVGWRRLVADYDDDWIIAGNDMRSGVTGNVGIGTGSPGSKLSVLEIDLTGSSVMDVIEIVRITSGTPTSGLGGALLFRNSLGGGVSGPAGRISSIMESVAYPSSSSGMLFEVRTPGGMLDGIYIDPAGQVGIGTRDPESLLEAAGTSARITLDATALTSPSLSFKENNTHLWTMEASYSSDKLLLHSGLHSNLIGIDQHGGIFHDYQGSSNAVYIQGAPSDNYALVYMNNSHAGPGFGLSGGMVSSSATASSYGVYGFNYGTGYGTYGKSYNTDGTGAYGINTISDNFGYAGGRYYGIYGENGNGNYGYLGSAGPANYGENSNGNFGYLGGISYGCYGYNNSGNTGFLGSGSYGAYASLATSGEGDYAVYGYGVVSSSYIGSDYTPYHSLGGVKGLAYWGNPYTFGVAGFSYLDYNRSGGCFGAKQDGTVFGCMGYQSSAGTEYGGYFTSSTTGAGKSAGTNINTGIGVWGDLFGAEIHGNVYGIYTEGLNYALYAHGDVYRDGLDVHVQNNGNSDNLPLYTVVSEDAMVQTCGYATLSNGYCTISFSPSFSETVSQTEPIVVTVTPLGNTQGVYLSNIGKNGFTVVENNGGKSSVTVSYIAMGKRAGYENPPVSNEVVASDYISKLSRGLHNDSDKASQGEGLYYENGNLAVGIHPSTLTDGNKPPAEEAVSMPEGERDQRIQPAARNGDTHNGKAPENK
jgi:hypothetical protein